MDFCEFFNLFTHDLFCGCKGSFDCCCCCTFRAYQIDLCVRVSGTAFEVTVRSTDCDSLCSRCLTDGAARSAGNLQHSYACIQKHTDVTVTEKFFVGLSGSDGAGTAYVLVYVMSFKYQGCFCYVCIACVCTASDKYLLNRFSLNIFQRDYVVRLMRT